MSHGTIKRTARWLTLMVSLLCSAVPAIAEITTEAQLKAAYLVNFLKYVDFPGNRTSINLCLFGRDSLGPQLAAYEGKLINGRELHIRKVSSPEQLADCQELFIPDTEEGRVAAVLRWAEKSQILTVSDADSFTHDGGAIAIIRTEGRLQFDINTDALGRANLKAASQMLRLARQVTGSAK